MANIDEVYKQFKSTAELQQYCETQYKTILELSKQKQLLEEENRNLKKMLTEGVPFALEKEVNIKYREFENEEATCLEQIEKLKETSAERELSYEEAKKLDIYTKLLLNIRENKPKKDDPLKGLDEKELLASINGSK